jgi:ABC-type branched-subunit amino acid transport system substrate-binding protein
VAALVLAAAIGLSTAACSSSGGSSSSSSASAAPIQLGMITDIHTSAADDSAAVAAAKGAVRAQNAAGGVNGHPLRLTVCNENLNTQTSEACIREMVSKHMVAMVGNTIYFAEAYADESFRAAGIAQIGNWASGISEQDPNSYLFFGGQTYVNAAQLYGAVQWAGKRIALVREDLPYTAPYFAFYQKACVQLGCTVVSTAVVPSETTSDYGPIAAQLMKGKPDVIVPDLGGLMAPLLQSLDQLGYRGKVVQQDNNYNYQSYFNQPVSLQRQYILMSVFPPPFAQTEFASLKQFVAEMKAEKASGDTDAPTYTNYSSTVTMDAYLAVKVFVQLATKAHAYTAASFKKAMDAAQDINLLGLAPPWTPSKVLFTKLPRASLDSFYFYTTSVGSTPQLLNRKSAAVTSIVKAGYPG